MARRTGAPKAPQVQQEPIDAFEEPTPIRPPGTVERPQPPKCGCQATAEVYTRIGSLTTEGGQPLRIHVTIKSVVECDPGTPGHCRYTYSAAAEVQRFRPRRGNRPATWLIFRGRRAYVQAFTVHGEVNRTEKPDRVDLPALEVGEWFPRAPQKEKTRVTLELVASARGGWKATINREVELCVPKLEAPKCPET